MRSTKLVIAAVLAAAGPAYAEPPAADGAEDGAATKTARAPRATDTDPDRDRTEIDATTGVVASSPEPSPGQQVAAADATLIAAGLKTDTFRERSAVSEIGWQLLALPEHLVEAVFFPIGRMVSFTERHAIADRVVHLFEITDNIKVTPKIKAATGDGLGFGLSLDIETSDVHQREYEVSGLYQIDGDFEVGAEVNQNVARLEGRNVSLEAEYERDQSNNYFGIGSGTDLDDERELGINTFEASLTGDLVGKGLEALGGSMRVSYMRQELYPGIGNDPPAGVEGDTVVAPPGFGDVTHFVTGELIARYDRRDTAGRTSKGAITEASLAATSDVQGNNLSAITGKLTGQVFMPIWGRQRAISLHAGLGAAEPLTQGDEIPLHGLITLGRKNFLRGYSKERFRSTRGWWGGVEYRYPVWYYDDDPTVLNSVVFVDVGNSSNEVGDLFTSGVHYSYGFGFSIERFKSSIASFQFGRSPEGNEVIFGVGGVL